MASAPFMQLYVGDYLADTLDLTCEEHGAYLLLLMTMWRHDAKLPNDAKKLARICRLSARRWDDVWSSISRFFDVTDGIITNPRLSKEYEKARDKSELRADAGRKGGQAKALKSNDAPLANATVLPKHSSEPEPYRKEEAKASSQKNRGSRLSKDWALPKAWGEWAISEGWADTHIRSEADKFRDYWVGKAGRDGTKMDWEATFRNWMRNSKSANSQQKAKPNGWTDTWRGILSDARMADGADCNTVVPLLSPRR